MVIERVGRYEIQEVLGRGAMGVVYLARDPLIDRQVALKTLRVDLEPELADEFRERFLREARAAGRLSHRCIVTIHDVGEDQETGLVYIAMEYIRGRNLKQLLAAGLRLRPGEAARITTELAEALHYAHAQGVIHRDIKPANIILTEDGTPKITDFGVARLESSNLTVEGQFIGTPNYMSPEQVTGQGVDGRSDLFSLGVVLYELLTLQRPFPGRTMHEVTQRIVHEAPPIPSTVAPGLPPSFNPVLLKCLDKDPGRRFQTGAELAAVLAALARTLVQREPGDAERTGLVQPELGTRIAAGDRRPPAVPSAPPAWRRLLDRLRRLGEGLPLPEFLRWEVNPAWVWRTLGVWVLLWALLLAFLTMKREPGPFPAPSPGSVRNLHHAADLVREARRLLAQGDAAGAEARALAALDQAPASPATRRTLAEARHQLGIVQASAQGLQQAAGLVDEGRNLYNRGQYGRAAQRFEQALSLNPTSELARSYLDLARERIKAAPRRQPTPTAGGGFRASPGVEPSQSLRLGVQPTPGSTRVTVFFNSPINAGSLVVTLDGQSLAEIPFDFTRKGLLGIKHKGTGQVKRVLLVPSGRHAIGIQLSETERGSLGDATLTENLAAGTDWTLRADLPEGATRASFYLVKVAGH